MDLKSDLYIYRGFEKAKTRTFAFKNKRQGKAG